MSPAVATIVPTTLGLDLLGTRVDLRFDPRRRGERLRRLLEPFVVGDGSVETGSAAATFELREEPPRRGGPLDHVVVHRDGAVVAEGRWPAVEAELLAALNALAIEGYDGIAVHAGVVARGDRVIAFPGVSGAGKSTITAACLRAGFAYVSDEALCIDPTTRRVVAYPRPLALSTASCALIGIDDDDDHDDRHDDSGSREVLVTAPDLGASVAAPGGLRLTDVVELERGATVAHLESVHRSRLVPSLLSMSFNHFKDPDTAVELLEALAPDVAVWRLHLDDPLDAAALLARELG